jgi:phosphoribosylformimino-5-aminoimidazole carboxamide ribonucleotide (ProFAR) isomerase
MPTQFFALIPVVRIEGGRATLPPSPIGEVSPPTSPLEVARYWSSQGAQRIQVIDADAAAGKAPATHAISELVRKMHNHARIDLVSGVFDDATLAEAAQTKPAQLVLSTKALADLDFVARAVAKYHAEISLRLVIGEGGVLHAPGSAADGLDIWTLLPQLDAMGIAHYLVVDAATGGHWWSRHHSVLAQFCASTSVPVTAGSGVSSLENIHDLCNLAADGLDGVVIGHALDTGLFTYAEAKTGAEARYDPYEWGPAQP